MEEIKKARNIDQIRGLEWKDLRSAVLAIAQVHSQFWNYPALKKAKGLPLHRYMRAHQLKKNLPRFLRWANLSDENKDLFSTLPDRVPSVLARLKNALSLSFMGISDPTTFSFREKQFALSIGASRLSDAQPLT